MDNCWSIYKNNFEAGLSFSFDLNDLGIFYNLYSDLMDFWDKECPGKIYNLIYENLTTNQETEIKNLLKFCELSFSCSEAKIKTRKLFFVLKIALASSVIPGAIITSVNIFTISSAEFLSIV